ncbi:hypothetical protein [Cellvibrio sp. NN19]|uniref:hypothetical protein n=1 Tax=Cellvibrio chitinivorans TaxID=3102792 RepID=UPI002B400F6D|nr:hypothetical protein [Cellvibrio sp. NN19]
MLINKKRIKSIGGYAKGLANDKPVIICVPLKHIDLVSAVNCGFSPMFDFGETVLPSAKGSVARFNSQGKHIALKDLPKERVYRQGEWKWKQFCGRNEYEEMSKIVDIPYSRYQRDYVEAPSVELSIVGDASGGKLISASKVIFNAGNECLITHTVNLFLEIFGMCELRNENLDSIISSPIKKLNWDILPKGRKPWGELKTLISPVINNLPEGNKAVIEKRFESINVFEPEFVAVGRAGFSGYLVFGFPAKSLFILECTQINNATYVIENNWEQLSGLTKAEILNNKLHKQRVMHCKSWFSEVNKLLSKANR